MFDRYFSLLYEAVSRKKWGILASVLLVTFASLAGLFFVKLDSNIELMLPEHEVVEKNINFLRTSNHSGKVILSLGLTSPELKKEDLHRAVDQVAASLDPELFPTVMVGLTENDLAKDVDVLFENLPEILSQEELHWIESQIDRDPLSKKLEQSYKRLLTPGGIFMNAMVRSDPLGLKLLILQRLKALSSSLGFEVEMENGHFISGDGRHAMIIAQTPVSVADTVGAKRLLTSLEQTLGKLPAHISADIICGHAHTFSNEKIIKRDIQRTLIIASLAFLILFVFIIGDLLAILIYLLPVMSIVLAMNLSYWILGGLSTSVVGIGAVVAGISVDYGIHAYFAARRPRDPAASVRHVAKPVIMGALTTTGIFFAFFFSSIDGYHQMALFTILSIVLAVVYALLLLPQFLPGTGDPSGRKRRLTEVLENLNVSRTSTVFGWGICTIILTLFALNINFENDIRAVDGTEKKILQAEERFRDVWGQKELAILVTEAPEYEEALALNEKIYLEASETLGAGNLSSLAAIWPSAKTRRQNADRWQRFWRGGSEQKLKRLLDEEGAKVGFSEHAFDPFFDGLYGAAETRNRPDEKKGVLRLEERFLQQTDSGYQVLSFFPDTENGVADMISITERNPGTFLVSGKVLSRVISQVVIDDMKVMTGAAALLVVLLTFFFLRNIRETLVALVPVVTSVVWLLGVMSILKLSLNVANLVSGIVVMGLCVDYGIFMTYKSRSNMSTDTVLAVTLSAISTLIGAGVLLFAEHPALFSIGLTIVIGIGAGYLSSILVVPRLFDLLVQKERKLCTA